MVLFYLIKRVFYKKVWLYIRMSENTNLIYFQWNLDLILNRSKDHYKNNKERLREQARDKYRNLSEEKKNKTDNMEKTDAAVCLKRRKRDEKNTKKIIVRLKSLNI